MGDPPEGLSSSGAPLRQLFPLPTLAFFSSLQVCLPRGPPKKPSSATLYPTLFPGNTVEEVVVREKGFHEDG